MIHEDVTGVARNFSTLSFRGDVLRLSAYKASSVALFIEYFVSMGVCGWGGKWNKTEGREGGWMEEGVEEEGGREADSMKEKQRKKNWKRKKIEKHGKKWKKWYWKR